MFQFWVLLKIWRGMKLMVLNIIYLEETEVRILLKTKLFLFLLKFLYIKVLESQEMLEGRLLYKTVSCLKYLKICQKIL